MLRDLGQLWAYCKLIDSEEAFLFSSTGLGSLNKLINSFRREDLLDFGEGKNIKNESREMGCFKKYSSLTFNGT